MKYPPRAYAEAFLLALAEGLSSENATSRLSSVLRKNGDYARAGQVVHEVEGILAEKNGGRMVRVEFAREQESAVREKILSRFDAQDRVTVVVNPTLIAGVRVLLNGEEELDVSLSGKLQAMLG